MATTFADLAPLIRAALGDYDAQSFLYSDDAINSQLRLLIMTMNDSTFQENGQSFAFTTDLAVKQKAQAIFKVAIAMCSPQSNYFSYRTPIQSVTRSGGAMQLLAWLQGQLDLVNGGAFAIACDDELSAMLQGPRRYTEALDQALTGL